MENKLERKYGLFTAICMVVGIVIGSGVFFKAQTILTKTGGNMPMGILAWVIGGAIMLFNVLAFAQLAQNYSKVNGLTCSMGGKELAEKLFGDIEVLSCPSLCLCNGAFITSEIPEQELLDTVEKLKNAGVDVKNHLMLM